MTKRSAKVIKASKALQMKVGTGTIDDQVLEKAQKLMDENKIDFAPLAKEHVSALVEAIQDAESKEPNGYENVDLASFSTPIMNLKGNAGSFHYQLIGDISGAVLSLLEHADRMDKKLLEIMQVLHKTILLIMAQELKGLGGKEGKQLNIAFQELCTSYAKGH